MKGSLHAAKNQIDYDYHDEDVMNKSFQLFDVGFLTYLLDGRKCNPYFFQMLFETQSCDLSTKVFSSKSNIAPLIINPLECFVTAWCVANSDPTSQWNLKFNDDLLLEGFVEHYVRFKNVCESTRSSYGSVTEIDLRGNSSLKQSIFTTKLVKTFSSLFPYLEMIMFDINPAGIAENVPLLCSVLKLSSLKTLTIGTCDQEGDELPAAVCIPPLHCPSLTTIFLSGRAGASLIESLVLPNINNLSTIMMFEGCSWPMSGSEFSNYCSCLCQSTSRVFLKFDNVDLSAHELKELASVLEQISSLKMVKFDDNTILAGFGIQLFKETINKSTVIQAIDDGIIDRKTLLDVLDDVMRIFSTPLRSLLSDQYSSQSLDLVTADIQSSSHHSERDVEDDELHLELAQSASIQTAQDEQGRRDEEQQHSTQEALPEDGQEENDRDLEDDELQQAIALSLEENIEQIRRDEEQQHAAQSKQEALQMEDEQNDLDQGDDELRKPIALSMKKDEQEVNGKVQQEIGNKQLELDEDELMLQQAIALSLRENDY